MSTKGFVYDPRLSRDTVLAYIIFSLGLLQLIFLFFNWSYDDPYITYRYAVNLAAGKGFVYNQNERTLSTTSPLFAILLSGIEKLGVISIPRAAILVGCLSLSLSGYLLWEMSQLQNASILGWTSFLLFSTFALPATTISSETPLYICLILLTVFLYSQERWILTAVTSTLLLFVRPDGILLPFVLGTHFFINRKTFQGNLLKREHVFALMIFLLVNLVGWGAIWFYYGSPIPVTLFAKQQQGGMNISQQFLGGFFRLAIAYVKQPSMALEGCLALLGLFHLARQRNNLLLLVGWTFVYLIAYSLLRVSRYYWYYAPLIPGFIVLVGAGLKSIWDWASRVKDYGRIFVRVIVGCVFLICFIGQNLTLYRTAQNPDLRILVYRQVGLWLKQNTPPNAKVGALEVGAIGFYSERYMVDFAGLIQPDVAAQMTSTSTYEDTARYAIEKYHPDYIVLHKGVFLSLEQELLRDCIKKKTFKASQFNVKYDLIILYCNP